MQLSRDECDLLFRALAARENEICAEYEKAGPAQLEVCKRELRMLRTMSNKVQEAYREHFAIWASRSR